MPRKKTKPPWKHLLDPKVRERANKTRRRTWALRKKNGGRVSIRAADVAKALRDVPETKGARNSKPVPYATIARIIYALSRRPEAANLKGVGKIVVAVADTLISMGRT